MDTRRHIDPTSKVIEYNPKFDELFAPVIGPSDPNKSDQDNAPKNTLTGFIEPAHVNDFQFDVQRKTFHSYGEEPGTGFTNRVSRNMLIKSY
jgi:pre-mRNA-processing factor 17